MRTDTRQTVTGNSPWGIYSSLEESGLDLKNTRVQGDRQHCFSSSNLSDRVTPFSLRDVEVYGLGQLYWGARLYNVVEGFIDHCHFHDIGVYASHNFDGVKPGKLEGHALYFNLQGNLEVYHTLFENCLGQGIQIVWREHETLLERPEGLIQIKDCQFKDCSRFPGDRAAYPLSIFNTEGHDVIVRRVSIFTTESSPIWWNTRLSKNCRSHGAALFQGGPDKTLDIKHLNVRLLDPDRPGVKIDGFGKIRWDGGHLVAEGQKLKIEINSEGDLDLKNLRGDYEVILNGVRQ